MINQIIVWLKSNWKEIVIGVLAIILIAIGYYEYQKHEAVPMTTIQENTVPEITKALDKLDIKDVSPKEVQNSIEKATTSTPQKIFITSTQKEADTQANKLAKADKADKIIKQQEKATNSKDNEIVNNYYALHLEKNNKIKAGVTVVDSQIYENIAYQHKKDEIILQMQLNKSQPIQGVTYVRTISAW